MPNVAASSIEVYASNVAATSSVAVETFLVETIVPTPPSAESSTPYERPSPRLLVAGDSDGMSGLIEPDFAAAG